MTGTTEIELQRRVALYQAEFDKFREEYDHACTSKKHIHDTVLQGKLWEKYVLYMDALLGAQTRLWAHKNKLE